MFTALVVLGDSSNSTDFVSVVVIAALFYSFAFVIKCPDSKHLMEHEFMLVCKSRLQSIVSGNSASGT